MVFRATVEIVAVAVVVTLMSSSQLVAGNTDSDALIAFRNGLIDPDNVLASWNETLVNACSWLHVACDDDNSVIRVDLGAANLGGHIAPEIGQLQKLQYLNLFRNRIQGTIPPQLGNLRSLISLNLYNNGLTGTIPPQLGNLKSLVFLRLNNNHLTGKVPAVVAKLPNLKVLDVSGNNLSPPAAKPLQ